MTTIIGMTLKEVVRKKILLVTVLLTIGFLALYGFGLHFAYSSATGVGADPGSTAAMLLELMPPMFMTIALFFGTFILAFLAVMSAAGSISLEIEDGIMHGLAPRPIRRSSIVLGKALGYAIMLALFSGLFYEAIVLTTSLATGVRVAGSPTALGLYIFHPMILLSLTMLGTTFISTIANAIIVFMLYALSILGGTMEQIGYVLRNNVLINTGIVTSLAMPADSLYRKIVNVSLPSGATGLTSGFLGPFGSAGEPSIWMVVYATLYVAGMVALAVRVFSRRDI